MRRFTMSAKPRLMPFRKQSALTISRSSDSFARPNQLNPAKRLIVQSQRTVNDYYQKKRRRSSTARLPQYCHENGVSKYKCVFSSAHSPHNRPHRWGCRVQRDMVVVVADGLRPIRRSGQTGGLVAMIKWIGRTGDRGFGTFLHANAMFAPIARAFGQWRHGNHQGRQAVLAGARQEKTMNEHGTVACPIEGYAPKRAILTTPCPEHVFGANASMNQFC